jgi:sulfur-oxidizing protein SoxY
MQLHMEKSVLDRRAFLLGASAAAVLAPFLAGEASAQEPKSWEEALKKILGDAQPVTNGRMVLDVPEIAENGNMVPFTVTVESPMTDKDYVRTIHVLATANPQPSVATFRLTPLSGRASVASRMRLARTQDVIGVAELSDGRILMTRKPVKVTIGGCGG